MEEMTSHPQKPHEYRGILLINYTASSGVQVRCGCRQSIPSKSIDSYARVKETVPSLACGQTNRPRSSRLVRKDLLHPTKAVLRCRLCVLEIQTHARRTAADGEPSAPAHSVPESLAAYRSYQPQSRSWCPCATRSLAQALQNRLQHRSIGASLYTNRCPARKLYVDRSTRCRRLLAYDILPITPDFGTRHSHHHWQQ
jgi:hypothetical protein